MKLKLLLLLIVGLYFSSSLSYSDSNGIWTYAEDIVGGEFGADESVNNFTFSDVVYFNEDLIYKSTRIEDLFLNRSGDSMYGNLDMNLNEIKNISSFQSKELCDSTGQYCLSLEPTFKQTGGVEVALDVLRIAIGLTPQNLDPPYTTYDVDNSGSVTVSDALQFLRYVTGEDISDPAVENRIKAAESQWAQDNSNYYGGSIYDAFVSTYGGTMQGALRVDSTVYANSFTDRPLDLNNNPYVLKPSDKSIVNSLEVMNNLEYAGVELDDRYVNEGQSNSIDSSMIQDGTITINDLNWGNIDSRYATNPPTCNGANQALGWTGSSWVCNTISTFSVGSYQWKSVGVTYTAPYDGFVTVSGEDVSGEDDSGSGYCEVDVRVNGLRVAKDKNEDGSGTGYWQSVSAVVGAGDNYYFGNDGDCDHIAFYIPFN